MRFLKDSIDYQINMNAFYEMEEVVPMTKRERDFLHRWASKGFDIESNPWNAVDDEGFPLNYLRAYRLENGYSSGPWDYWKGPEDQCYWDPVKRCYTPKDEY